MTNVQNAKNDHQSKIGLIGIGDMGLPMCRNLISAGYDVIACDLAKERLDQAVAAGATAGKDVADTLNLCGVLITSLPSSEAWISLVEKSILPHIREGQILIDTGTVRPFQAREFATKLKEQGAHLVDAPVSGGPFGVENKKLFIFAGGEEDVYTQIKPVLVAIGGNELLTYCGPAGSGQIVKGINQLAMGLHNSVFLETIAYGANQGIPVATIQKAIGDLGPMRKKLSDTAQTILDGKGNNVDYKVRELPYFLDDVSEAGFTLPMTQALYQFCKDGEIKTIQDKREAPAFWHELTKGKYSE